MARHGYNSENDYPVYDPPESPPLKRRKTDDKLVFFDRSINIGNVVAFIALIIAMLTAYNGIISRMIVMENKVDMMWSKFEVGFRKP